MRLDPEDLAAIAAAVCDELERRRPTAASPTEHVDRHGAGLGRAEWRALTREVPAYRVGRRLLVRAEDLRRWIERHRVVREAAAANDSAGDELDLASGRLRRVGAGR